MVLRHHCQTDQADPVAGRCETTLADSAERGGALARGLRLLSLFSHGHPGLTLAELSARSGIPKSTTLRLMQCLEGTGFVEYDPSGQYRVGLKAFEVGNVYCVTRGLHQVADPILERLATLTAQSVHLAVLDQGQIVHLITRQPNRPFRCSIPLGYREYAHSSGLGKVLLSELPESELDAIIARLGLPPWTENTITDPRRLKACLAEVTAQGYALDDEESAVGLRCVAAAVRNGQGRIIAAISAAGHALELQGEPLARVIAEVRWAAVALSRAWVPYQAPLERDPGLYGCLDGDLATRAADVGRGELARQSASRGADTITE